MQVSILLLSPCSHKGLIVLCLKTSLINSRCMPKGNGKITRIVLNSQIRCKWLETYVPLIFIIFGRKNVVSPSKFVILYRLMMLCYKHYC